MLNDEYFMDSTHRKANANKNKYEDVLVKQVKKRKLELEEEINEIEEAINSKYSSCRKCISKALNLLYNREKPDYSNSVK